MHGARPAPTGTRGGSRAVPGLPCRPRKARRCVDPMASSSREPPAPRRPAQTPAPPGAVGRDPHDTPGVPGASSAEENPPPWRQRSFLFQCVECEAWIVDGAPLFRANDCTYCSQRCRAAGHSSTALCRPVPEPPSCSSSSSSSVSRVVESEEGEPCPSRVQAAIAWLSSRVHSALIQVPWDTTQFLA
jgi:hypothetical protein